MKTSNKVFFFDLGLAFFFFYTIKYRFNYSEDTHFSIIKSVVEIFKGFEHALNLIIGMPRTEISSSYEHALSHLVERKFLDGLLNKIPELNLSIYFTNKKNRIHNIQSQFTQFWGSESVNLEQNYYDLNMESKEIAKKLNKEWYKALLERIQSIDNIDDPTKVNLAEYLNSLKFIAKATFYFDKKESFCILSQKIRFLRERTDAVNVTRINDTHRLAT